MPELIEVEAYRRLAEQALERKITEVIAPDAWWLKGGLSADVLSDALVGRHFLAARRTGKRIMLDTSDHGPVLGLRFGMTGRLLVDGAAGVEKLEYSSNRDVEAWDRLVVRFADGGDLRVRDPRRLGGAELDPETDKLGPDAVGLGLAGLRKVLGESRVALKARLMDQSKIAGLGNLIVDEALFQAGLDPARPAGGLDDAALKRLHQAIRKTLTNLTKRGGSHTGALQPARHRDGVCPLDGAPLLRRTIGGRTTYSCPVHQR
ncbi:MAG TPA: DNA-formamidopyrimidine glycosylase family protein [Acidimicrobiia bacterium]|nr:DNA-formamidopyrimidine glycosylase family protein [Acidimicrobiia bacterium]